MENLIWVFKKAIKFIPIYLLLAFILINVGALLPAFQIYGLEKVIQEISNTNGSEVLKEPSILIWGIILILAYIMPHIITFLQSIAISFGIYNKFIGKFNTWFYLSLGKKDCQAYNDESFIKKKEKAINALEIEAPITVVHNSLLFFSRIITIGSLTIVLIGFHWALFLLALGLMIPIMLINRRNRREATDLRARQTSIFVRSKYLWNTLSNRRIIKENRLMNYDDYIANDWYSEKEKEILENIDLEKKINKRGLISGIINGIGYLLCTMLSIYLMEKSLITIAGFIASLNAFYYFQLEGRNLIEDLNSLAKNVEFCRYIKEFEESYNTIVNKEISFKNNTPRKIELKNISYKYPGSENYAISNVSLTIKENESVAIIGANGSGKTTLVHLISGVFEPTEGEVLINRQNPRKTLDESLYKAVGVVPQQITKYQGKLKDILEMGMTNLNESRWRESFKLLDLTNLNNSFNNVLGPEFEGIDLSGGQWQKLAIARVLAYPYSIVLLDEPTSNLDPVIESEIFESMLSAIDKRTSIIISHRMALCTRVDKIIIMDQGRIVGEGSHSHLMSKDSLYRRMFMSQKH